MGEKIKDLHKISIGNAELMIELNEGYTKKQGRVIHVQNSHFRYLIKEYDFLHLTAEILRAKSELDYIKCHVNLESDFKKKDNGVLNSNEDAFIEFVDFISFLQKSNIRYKKIETRNKLATIIIDPSHRKRFVDAVLSNKEIIRLNHPYGKFFGYTFLYQMHDFSLLKYRNKYIEIFYELPCLSTTENTWIPLDRSIQNRIWASPDDNIDEIAYMIYRICWAIFIDKEFSSFTISVIENTYPLVDLNDFQFYLDKVFFKYSKRMIEHFNHHNFNDIVREYFTFVEY